MSEMLGNQYFISRNYQLAGSVYLRLHQSDPSNNTILKRLIICYTQTGELNKAFDFFYELVKQDVSEIINTDHFANDCPCLELTEKYGKVLPYENNSTDLKLMLGILWLYCDAQKSVLFFEQLCNTNPKEKKYEEILFIIRNYLSNKKLIHTK